MDRKNIIHRRRFLLQIGALGTAGSGLLSETSAAPGSASGKTIKLSSWPSSLPFLLDETFGPADAKGSDIHKWLTVLRFELVKHVDAEGRDALVENLTSGRFEGEVSMTAGTHETSSVEAFSKDRWRELNPEDNRKNIWTQQMNDRDGNPKIYVYDSKPLRASNPIGFKWVVKLNNEGQIDLNYSDTVKEALERPIDANTQPHATGFQLGLALDPAPESTSDEALSVTADAAAYGAWTPTEGIRAVEISYNGSTPNFSLRKTASLSEIGMGTNRGGIRIGYMTAKTDTR